MNTQEPVVLGKVKKGSAGKPIVVIIIFLFVGALILFLPTMISYFGDYNIIDLIKNGQIVDFFINHDNYVDKPLINNNNNKDNDKEKKSMLINNKAILNGDNFTLSNFILTNDGITYTINVNNEINFDEKNYYLILSKNDKEVTSIKLTDNISTNLEQSFKFREKLNDTVGVNGIIKTLKDSDYPNFIVSSDESGLGSLICVKDNYNIEYIFQNNNLIRVKETLEYLDNNNDYLSAFQNYSNIVTKINNASSIASIEENYRGFIFKTDIDLSKFNNSIKNYNYYSLNTKANKINFEMNAKGYDCK